MLYCKGRNFVKKILSALFVFNIFIYVVPALLPSVYAFTMRSAQEVVIPKDQTISGTFVAQGQTIRIDGPIQGDLICAGQTVEITSTIEGDVICAGQSIAIRGSVNGNIRAAAQTLTVSGRIARNITALGQTITEDAPIGGELLVGGQTMTMNGSTKGDTAGAVQNAVINGQIGHNLILTVGNLTVSNGAKIAGTVDYTSARNAMIAGGTVSGKVIRHQPKQEQHQQTVNWGAIWFGEFLASLIFNLVIALIFVALWPFAMQRVTNNMKMSIWRSIGIGILVFILTPILAFFMLVTIIGIPLRSEEHTSELQSLS